MLNPPFMPIDVHCHGVGRFDFSEVPKLDLQEIDSVLAGRGEEAILTLYLLREYFDDFLALMERFAALKSLGACRHIRGFALEGPILASCGGTPPQALWQPTQTQWRQLAACGQQGLVYIIFSPDAIFMGRKIAADEAAPSLSWLAETLLEGGVLPAPGHFFHQDPAYSSKKLQVLFDVVKAWGKGPIVTDHLFNDMPLKFKHAWRDAKEKRYRLSQITQLKLHEWCLDNLDEKLGPVPATLVRNAHEGLVKIAQNFDGEHVDLAIIKKTIELVGLEHLLMMTDSIESRCLAGRLLRTGTDSCLLYQDEGVVAASCAGIERQLRNMRFLGLTAAEIKQVTYDNPNAILQCRGH